MMSRVKVLVCCGGVIVMVIVQLVAIMIRLELPP